MKLCPWKGGGHRFARTDSSCRVDRVMNEGGGGARHCCFVPSKAPAQRPQRRSSGASRVRRPVVGPAEGRMVAMSAQATHVAASDDPTMGVGLPNGQTDNGALGKEQWVRHHADRLLQCWLRWRTPLGIAPDYATKLEEDLAECYEQPLLRTFIERTYGEPSACALLPRQGEVPREDPRPVVAAVLGGLDGDRLGIDEQSVEIHPHADRVGSLDA